MWRPLLALMTTLTAAAALAPPAPAAAQSPQTFVTVAPKPEMEAWWLRATFHPLHTEVRGIPVQQIHKSWCKATELKKELLPRELFVEKGKDTIAENGLAFAVEGNFDRSKVRQTALVGVYATCAGKTGSFVLILDPPRDGPPKIRFFDQWETSHQFAALSAERDSSIVVMSCMECDNGDIIRWDRAKRRFAWVRSR